MIIGKLEYTVGIDKASMRKLKEELAAPFKNVPKAPKPFDPTAESARKAAAQARELARETMTLRRMWRDGRIDAKHFSDEMARIRSVAGKGLDNAIANFGRGSQAASTFGLAMNRAADYSEEAAGKISKFRLAGQLNIAMMAALNDQIFRISPALAIMSGGFSTGTKSVGAFVAAIAPLLAIGIALVGTFMAVGRGIREAIDVEALQARVQKTTNLAAEEIEKLTVGFNRLSAQLPSSTKDLLEIAAVAGQLGITGTRNIERFSTTIAKLSLATDVVGEEGATQLARFLQATGTSTSAFGSEAERVGNILNALENSMAATASEILKTTEYTGQLATRFNLSKADLLAYGAATVSVGQRSEALGTAFSKTFSDITNAALEGGRSLGMMAELTDMTKEAFRDLALSDPSEALRRLVNGMGEAAENGGNLTDILHSLGIVEERQIRVIASLVGGRDKLNEALATANDLTETQNSLDREVAIQAATTESRLKMLGNTVANMGRELGVRLLPVVNDVARALTGLFDAIGTGLAKVRELNSESATLKDRWDALVQSSQNPVEFAINFDAVVSEGLQEMLDWFDQQGKNLGLQGPQREPQSGGRGDTGDAPDGATTVTVPEDFLTLAKLQQKRADLEAEAQAMRLEGNDEAVASIRREIEATDEQIKRYRIMLGLAQDSTTSQRDSTLTASKVMAEYADEITKATGEFELFGDQGKYLQDQLNAATTALGKLLDPNTIGVGQAAVQEVADTITGLQQDLAKFQIFDRIQAGGARAVREAIAQGNTLEAQAKSLDTRIGLIRTGIADLLGAGFAESSAEVEYLRGRLNELLAEAQAITHETERAARNTERRSAAQQARGDGTTPDAPMTPEEVKAALRENRAMRREMEQNRGRAVNEARAQQVALQQELARFGVDTTEAIKTGTVEGLRELEGAIVTRLNELGDDPAAAPLIGFLTRLRIEIERLDKAAQRSAVGRLVADLTRGDAFAASSAKLDEQNEQFAYTVQLVQRSEGAFTSYEDAVKKLTRAGVALNQDFLDYLLANYRSEAAEAKKATEHERELARARAESAAAAKLAADPQGFERTLSYLARAEGGIHSYIEAINAFDRAGTPITDELLAFLRDYFEKSATAYEQGIARAKQAQAEAAKLAEGRFGGKQGSVLALQSVERVTGAFTSMDDALLKLGRLGIPLTADMLEILTERFLEGEDAATLYDRTLSALVQGMEEFPKLSGALKDLAAATDLTLDPLDVLEIAIDKLEKSGARTKKEIAALREALALLRQETEQGKADKALAKQWEVVADKVRAAGRQIDLLKDLFDDPTNGNAFITALSESFANVAETFVPVIGKYLGEIARVAGQAINTILGDLSNGMRDVEAFITETARKSPLGESVVRGLTVVKQVSRGGLLGLLGFTKAQVDEEITNLQLSIAEGLAGGVASAIAQGIRDAIAGKQDAFDALKENLKASVLDALISAFVETAIIKAVLGPFLKTFSDLLVDENGEITEESVDRAFDYASQNFDKVFAQALGIAGRFADIAKNSPLAPRELANTDPTSSTPSGISVPLVPAPVMAAPAYMRQLENAAARLDSAAGRFDSAVDKFVAKTDPTARDLRNV